MDGRVNNNKGDALIWYTSPVYGRGSLVTYKKGTEASKFFSTRLAQTQYKRASHTFVLVPSFSLDLVGYGPY